MILTELTSVASANLSIDQLKAHLRLGTGFTDSDLQDELLETYLRAAISVVETRSGRILLQKQYSWQLTRWRNDVRQVLPVRPVAGITEIKLVEPGGSEIAVDAEDYRFIEDDICPAVEATKTILPQLPNGGVVDIVFDAGFGMAWDDIPSDLAQAVLIVATQAYENRSGASEAIPSIALSLIEPYRALRLMRGG